MWLTESEKELLTEIKGYLITEIEEIGGCDHSVGICCCKLIRDTETFGQLIEQSHELK